MADVTIDANVTPNAQSRSPRAMVFTTSAIGYAFYVDNADQDFKYRKTSDGGASWGAAVTIKVEVIDAFDVWFEQWTPGDSGTKIHTWYIGETASDVFYRALDTNGDSLGTERTVFNGASAVPGFGAYVSGAKARGGNMLVAFSIDSAAETGTYRSTDAGVTWGVRTDMNEAGNGDRIQMFPGGDADNQDMWALFLDVSADALTLKAHDDSANTNSESATIATIVDNVTETIAHDAFSGSVRASDNHLIVALFTERDTATEDFRVFDINGTASITEKTAISTNVDDQYYPAIYVDASSRIYVAYVGKRDGSETLGTTTGVYYTKSTDGGATWTSGDTAYSVGTSNYERTWCPLNGSLFFVGWLASSVGDYLANATNAVVYAAPASAFPERRELRGVQRGVLVGV